MQSLVHSTPSQKKKTALPEKLGVHTNQQNVFFVQTGVALQYLELGKLEKKRSRRYQQKLSRHHHLSILPIFG